MPSILETQRLIIERLERLEFGGCCPENTGLFDDVVTTDITPGEGEPPATWGDQNVADWNEWYNHLCGASYRYVDQLIATANQAQVVISEGAMTLAIIAAILSLLSGAGILVVIAYGTAAAGLNAVIQLAGTAVFEQAAIAMTTDKDKIVCGVMNDNLAQVMEDILSPSAWLFYRYVDWQSATNTLWEGGQPGGGNLPPADPTACPDCQDLTVYDFDRWYTRTDGSLWELQNMTAADPDVFEHNPRSGAGDSYQRQTREQHGTNNEYDANSFWPDLRRVDIDMSVGADFAPKTMEFVYQTEEDGIVTVPVDTPNGTSQVVTLMLSGTIKIDQSFTRVFSLVGRHNGSGNTSHPQHMIKINAIRIAGNLRPIE